MRTLLILLLALTLSACKEDRAQDTSAIPMSETSLGHYCQMNLLEHDGPKAQAHLAGLSGTPLFFSQVRDAVAYMRMPEQSHEILAVWVNDMGAPDATWAVPGPTNWITAKDAFYVVGGRAVGGMGTPEIVPFSENDKAADFAKVNGGEVMHLTEIPDSAVLAPVALAGDVSDAEFDERLRGLSLRLGE